MSFRAILLLIFLFLVGKEIKAQITISGIVIDESGALPYCTVQILNGSTGTISGPNGEFELIDVSPSDSLLISFVGYRPEIIPVGNQTYFEVELKPDIVALRELVVVGYGVQEKVNLTGSVVSMDAGKLSGRGVSNASNILAGQTPGLTVLQRGGSPGRNEGQIRIRGIGTLGADEKNDPLIIVDGIEVGSLTEINPDDIKNISVLKDASAGAIYGVRAANGVIIITTKRGQPGKITVNYSYQFGISEPTRMPEKVNSSELATLLNEAQQNEGLSIQFFDNQDLQLFESGDSPFTHTDSDQLAEIFNRNGIRQAHTLSVSGGNEHILHSVSLGYTDEQGLMAHTDHKRYNFRTNLDMNLSETISMGLNLSGSQRQIVDPVVGSGGIIHRAYREWANDPIRTGVNNWAFPIHALSQGIDHNSVALIRDGGSKRINDSRFTGTFFAEYSPWYFLSFKGIAATVLDFNRRREITKNLALFNPDETIANTSQSSILEGRDNFTDINLQFLVNFNRIYGDHGIRALAGFNSRSIEQSLSTLSALDLQSNNLDQINAADLTQDNISGITTDYRLLSYFGRINYVYHDRYLLEANLRYDGTSRFARSNRFHLFPSFSLGWRIAEEPFFNVSQIDDLKIRASWGQLGNQEIGEYGFLNTYVFDQTAFIGNTETSGATEKIPLGNPDIIWESTTMYNVGIDMSLLARTISITGDYFIRSTEDVLIQKPLAAVYGTGTFTNNFPFVNAASTENKGFEINLDYTNNIGELELTVNLNFSKVKTTITDLAGTDQPGMSIGDPIANIYGYRAVGIFLDQAEIDAHAGQSALGPASRPGDIKYQDISGPDGRPDGLINDLDRKNLGSFFPSINYGFAVGLKYNGFDFSTLWQGVADVKAEIGGRQRQPFYFGASPWKLHLDRAVTNRDGEVTNSDARYPRVLLTGNTKNYVTSSWWVEETAFLKLRNARLGYTFPNSVIEKLKITSLRIYISGENLLTITRFKGFDPEIPTQGSTLPVFAGNEGYPVTRTYFFGIKLSF